MFNMNDRYRVKGGLWSTIYSKLATNTTRKEACFDWLIKVLSEVISEDPEDPIAVEICGSKCRTLEERRAIYKGKAGTNDVDKEVTHG